MGVGRDIAADSLMAKAENVGVTLRTRQKFRNRWFSIREAEKRTLESRKMSKGEKQSGTERLSAKGGDGFALMLVQFGVGWQGLPVIRRKPLYRGGINA